MHTLPSEPLPTLAAERRAVSLASALTEAYFLDDALEGLEDVLYAGVNPNISNRAGWLLLRWHDMAEAQA